MRWHRTPAGRAGNLGLAPRRLTRFLAQRCIQVGAAGLDVFANEPMPNDHPLFKFDQVVLTPHIGGLTQDAAERMAVSSAENILDFFEGKLDHTLIVNREEIDVALQT